jgi:hypothetical protein
MKINLKIIVPILGVVIIALLLIFNPFNQTKKNNQDSSQTKQEQTPIIQDGQLKEEKPRFTGQKLDNVKTLCDFNLIISDMFASDYNQAQKLNFDEVLNKLNSLEKVPPETIKKYPEDDFNFRFLNGIMKGSYTDYNSILNRYKETVKNSNTTNFYQAKTELQKEAIGRQDTIKRFYECKL